MNCLICHEEILSAVSWTTLWSRPKENHLCKGCTDKLPFINGDTCSKCSRPFSNLDPQFRKGNLCADCLRWNGDPEWSGQLLKNNSLFIYDDFLKETIARYKFRGDYILSRAFSPIIREKLSTVEFDYLVPIPLSPQRLYERGFNQSAALIHEAGFTVTELLHRIHSEKQSKKSRFDRIHFHQVFQPLNLHIENKKIILIDDIYTTGSTLYHAAKVLKAGGAASVCSLTLARG
ncbi:ComF family protein [Cytobacillus oceanisediminis]|uniref:Amidophosphoribosyltransferase n=1 Tax=Cytobacillus oceanisediminis TaxID=665099 RepID=A0ABX3CXG7_9BACI|nr:ComF family protein [Cytobacillus oceanisediminis]MCM3403686.1 ComF family protein [Cytobacillus oceanisediminis]MDK7666808.1 ComF family protein [Cytobacillus oceanisediminis]OHX49761.1 amidophosphoribosyltransferase [Cytobacillus oceanisediminis]QOK29784.1 ComF family protein [Cytobacillus oceanisediminis]